MLDQFRRENKLPPNRPKLISSGPTIRYRINPYGNKVEVSMVEQMIMFEREQLAQIQQKETSKSKTNQAHMLFDATLEVTDLAEKFTRICTAQLQKVDFVYTKEVAEDLKKLVDKHVRLATKKIYVYLSRSTVGAPPPSPPTMTMLTTTLISLDKMMRTMMMLILMRLQSKAKLKRQCRLKYKL
ncbi:hypothetical protein Droror1_Dr00023990 [Drosera rotundifolia]